MEDSGDGLSPANADNEFADLSDSLLEEADSISECQAPSQREEETEFADSQSTSEEVLEPLFHGTEQESDEMLLDSPAGNVKEASDEPSVETGQRQSVTDEVSVHGQEHPGHDTDRSKTSTECSPESVRGQENDSKEEESGPLPIVLPPGETILSIRKNGLLEKIQASHIKPGMTPKEIIRVAQNILKKLSKQQKKSERDKGMGFPFRSQVGGDVHHSMNKPAEVKANEKEGDEDHSKSEQGESGNTINSRKDNHKYKKKKNPNPRLQCILPPGETVESMRKSGLLEKIQKSRYKPGMTAKKMKHVDLDVVKRLLKQERRWFGDVETSDDEEDDEPGDEQLGAREQCIDTQTGGVEPMQVWLPPGETLDGLRKSGVLERIQASHIKPGMTPQEIIQSNQKIVKRLQGQARRWRLKGVPIVETTVHVQERDETQPSIHIPDPPQPLSPSSLEQLLAGQDPEVAFPVVLPYGQTIEDLRKSGVLGKMQAVRMKPDMTHAEQKLVRGAVVRRLKRQETRWMEQENIKKWEEQHKIKSTLNVGLYNPELMKTGQPPVTMKEPDDKVQQLPHVTEKVIKETPVAPVIPTTNPIEANEKTPEGPPTEEDYPIVLPPGKTVEDLRKSGVLEKIQEAFIQAKASTEDLTPHQKKLARKAVVRRLKKQEKRMTVEAETMWNTTPVVPTQNQETEESKEVQPSQKPSVENQTPQIPASQNPLPKQPQVQNPPPQIPASQNHMPKQPPVQNPPLRKPLFQNPPPVNQLFQNPRPVNPSFQNPPPQIPLFQNPPPLNPAFQNRPPLHLPPPPRNLPPPPRNLLPPPQNLPPPRYPTPLSRPPLLHLRPGPPLQPFRCPPPAHHIPEPMRRMPEDAHYNPQIRRPPPTKQSLLEKEREIDEMIRRVKERASAKANHIETVEMEVEESYDPDLLEINPNTGLPYGWIEITHDSGLPMFIHQRSNTATFSRPGFFHHHQEEYKNVPQKTSLPHIPVACNMIPLCHDYESEESDPVLSQDLAKITSVPNVPPVVVQGPPASDSIDENDAQAKFTQFYHKLVRATPNILTLQNPNGVGWTSMFTLKPTGHRFSVHGATKKKSRSALCHKLFETVDVNFFKLVVSSKGIRDWQLMQHRQRQMNGPSPECIWELAANCLFPPNFRDLSPIDVAARNEIGKAAKARQEKHKNACRVMSLDNPKVTYYSMETKQETPLMIIQSLFGVKESELVLKIVEETIGQTKTNFKIERFGVEGSVEPAEAEIAGNTSTKRTPHKSRKIYQNVSAQKVIKKLLPECNTWMDVIDFSRRFRKLFEVGDTVKEVMEMDIDDLEVSIKSNASEYLTLPLQVAGKLLQVNTMRETTFSSRKTLDPDTNECIFYKVYLKDIKKYEEPTETSKDEKDATEKESKADEEVTGADSNDETRNVHDSTSDEEGLLDDTMESNDNNVDKEDTRIRVDNEQVLIEEITKMVPLKVRIEKVTDKEDGRLDMKIYIMELSPVVEAMNTRFFSKMMIYRDFGYQLALSLMYPKAKKWGDILSMFWEHRFEQAVVPANFEHLQDQLADIPKVAVLPTWSLLRNTRFGANGEEVGIEEDSETRGDRLKTSRTPPIGKYQRSSSPTAWELESEKPESPVPFESEPSNPIEDSEPPFRPPSQGSGIFHGRSRSPRSLSPIDRCSLSPGRHASKRSTPDDHDTRSRSPRHYSPRGSRYYSPDRYGPKRARRNSSGRYSPRRQSPRRRSPIRYSPGRHSPRRYSPGRRYRSRGRSPGRYTSRQRSPGRFRSRSRSPPRRPFPPRHHRHHGRSRSRSRDRYNSRSQSRSRSRTRTPELNPDRPQSPLPTLEISSEDPPKEVEVIVLDSDVTSAPGSPSASAAASAPGSPVAHEAEESVENTVDPLVEPEKNPLFDKPIDSFEPSIRIYKDGSSEPRPLDILKLVFRVEDGDIAWDASNPHVMTMKLESLNGIETFVLVNNDLETAVPDKDSRMEMYKSMAVQKLLKILLPHCKNWADVLKHYSRFK